ncbi:hypothetical protein ENC19_26365 [Verrucosispora sp. CWR15]|uniref:Uncharacterized protein n=1 Tax=Verrucosispora sioxanthis TaxID=2499994 RepID=A0A6M1LCG0_9ACTN|nr:hypothetical protein [Verrucosispora sioxanthis]NEE66797.1 hypothetical protein [Verrucosispora sioxanthis]NGM15907.1 hypothetical protein [Verrucosispora sioxanthis]
MLHDGPGTRRALAEARLPGPEADAGAVPPVGPAQRREEQGTDRRAGRGTDDRAAEGPVARSEA